VTDFQVYFGHMGLLTQAHVSSRSVTGTLGTLPRKPQSLFVRWLTKRNVGPSSSLAGPVQAFY
jgi:hypothetical protein